MSNEIMIPASPGEVLDKISILQIKMVRIDDEEKTANVNYEMTKLAKAYEEIFGDRHDDAIEQNYALLKATNAQLWDVEDAIRVTEEDEEIVELCRLVHKLNKDRADYKSILNDVLGSSITEEKQYAGEGSAL